MIEQRPVTSSPSFEYDDAALRSRFAPRRVPSETSPPVDPKEVELPDRTAVEVEVFWGDALLRVDHLSPPRDYRLGSERGSVDFVVPDGTLAEPKSASLVTLIDTEPHVRVFAGASAAISKKAGKQETIEVPVGGREALVPLRDTERVELQLGVLRFVIRLTPAGKPVPRALLDESDRRVPVFFGLSVAAAGALVASMMAFVPPLGLTADEETERDRIFAILQFLESSAEREREATADLGSEPDDTVTGPMGERARSSEGKAGKLGAVDTNSRLAIEGPVDAPSVELSRHAAIDAAQNFGMIGLLNSMAPLAPTAPWGADFAVGRDAMSALGNLWGEPGESGGFGGLGLTGTGIGGGGPADVIGLGTIGVCPGGVCPGLGRGIVGGKGPGQLGHRTKTPRLRMKPPITSGTLPPELIQRIVRQNFGRFRFCYERGLEKNPNLAGRVTARFVIARDGSVAHVQSGGGDLPEASVTSCVLGAYRGLSFPPPEEGIVTVTYPIVFTPSG